MAAGHQAADVAKERYRELEFLRREVDSGALAPHLAALRVDLEGWEGEELLFLARVGSAQERMHAGEQLLPAHGLHHVVVGAVLERENDVLLRVAHGDEEHRHALRDVRAQPHQHLCARDVGHLPVEHEKIEAFAAGHLHGLAPAHIGVNVVSIIGDPAAEQGELVRIVF